MRPNGEMMASPVSMNIIGGGNVAKTLAASWQASGRINLQGVVNRRLDTAKSAVEFIGAGAAIDTADRLLPAELYLIGCPDTQIENCANQLREAGILRPGDVVFHCSGLLSSNLLDGLRSAGAWVASAHPMVSFADPDLASKALRGSYCGLEGDEVAVQLLGDLFQSLEMVTFALEAETKPLYHAAAVFACNYLVTLQDVALECFDRAGVDAELGRSLLSPILQGTVSNLKNLPPHQALTGPIARGDSDTVSAHLAALGAQSKELETLYRVLADRTLSLSRQQGSAEPEQLEAISELIQGSMSS